jgi:hypothetical protein
MALIILISVGAIGVFLGRGAVSAFLIQVFAITLVTLSSDVIISNAGMRSARVFPIYLELSFYFALVAVAEALFGMFGFYFEFLTPRLAPVISGLHRVSGLAAEPAFYCVVMAPSVVAVMVSSLSGRPCLPHYKSLIILASYILTFSSLGYAIIALTLLVLLFRRSSISSIVAKVTVALGLVAFATTIPQINVRIIDTYQVFVASELDNVNESSMALYKNALVTVQSAVEQPVFGAGLGGHESNYFKYLPDSILALGLNLNEKDAASLVLRLISEFGIPFTVIFYLVVFHLWTGLPSRADPDPVFWKKLTSTAILGIIVANSLRNGNYINYGFPFFLVLYYDVFRSLRRGDIPLAVSRRPEAIASLQ